MKIMTRDFGEIEIDENDIVTFAEPIIGFDELKKFVFLYDDEGCDGFAWLQSIEDEGICFIVADPMVASENYSPKLPKKTDDLLGNDKKLIWLVCVICEQFECSTINLKSPIVLNPKNKTAMQIILEDKYPVRQSLVQ